MSSNLINTGGLDFNEIKSNLKQFLGSAEYSEFLSDYDFEGSVISTLIDVLSYNTHYNALYTNLAINEMFIDSASKRSSLASIAKLLGYTPKSISTAKSIINIDVTPSVSNSTNLTIPEGTTFSTEISGVAYTFNLLEDISAVKLSTDAKFTFTDINIYEGERVTITYTQGPDVKFVIPEVNADTSSIRVKVYNPSTSSTTSFSSSKTIVDAGATDAVFFVKSLDGSLNEIQFGNGVLGKVVGDGSVVTISYLVCNGEFANGASLFSYAGGADSTNVYDITTSFASSGGAPEEDKESIRYYAPLSYQAQGRIVTANDYVSIINETYPYVETVNVWGGQDNVPPQYGKVFIAAKPYGRDAFTTLEKFTLKNGIINAKGMITVVPEFVDPKYYDVELVTNVYYNPTKTTLASGALSTLVKSTISDYANTLSKFESAFRHSALTARVDLSDKSIVSSITTLRVRNKINVELGLEANYSVDFKNPIAQSNTSTFYSTRFFLSGYEQRGYLKNEGTDIDFYTEDDAGIPYFQQTVGTIDYTGVITLDNMTIDSLYDADFEFVFWPSSYDIVPPNGTIVRLPMSKVSVNMIVDNLSLVKTAKFDHIFSASR